MKKSNPRNVRVILAAMLATVVASSASFGQEPERAATEPTPPPTTGDSWYYRASPERAPNLSIAKQKAQLRGSQRMARLEAMRWYGFSNSRPTASALAWTTMYSPAWQSPGGRPFAWHAYTSSRPLVIITQPTPMYR